MVVNYCVHAFGATITTFDIVSVEDLVEAVAFRKMLIKVIGLSETGLLGGHQ